MSGEEKRDVEKATLFLEDLKEQIRDSRANIQNLQSQIAQARTAIQQETGILNHAEFLLKKYNLPNRPKLELQKPEPVQPPLDVK